MAVQGALRLPALVFVVPKALRFLIKPRHGRALACCRFVSRSVWFGFVGRVKLLCSFSPFPHRTMLSHDSANKRCKCISHQVLFVCKLCSLGLGSRWTRPVPEGTGQAVGPGNPAAPRAPLSCCSVLSPSAGRKGNQTPPNLFCLFSAIATTLDWSHPPQWLFQCTSLCPEKPSGNCPRASDICSSSSLLTLIKISFATALIVSVRV